MYDHAKATQSLFTEVGARAIIIRSFPEPVANIKPEHDGFLFEAEPDQGVEFELAVTVPKNRNVKAIVVRSFQKDKPVIIKKNRADEARHYQMLFRKTVRSRATRDDTLSTKHDVNNIRLVLAENGIFQMWEIAVPTRIVGPTANFFLTIQMLYKSPIYNLDGRIYVPEHEYAGYQKWGDLQMLLGEMVDVEKLPKINKPLFETQRMPSISGNRYRVIFFCLASGLGLAQTDQGPAFIHWKKLLRRDRFACITENQLVEGDIITTDRGLQLTDVKILD